MFFHISKSRRTSSEVYEKEDKLTEKEKQLVEKEAEVCYFIWLDFQQINSPFSQSNPIGKQIQC